FCPHSRAIPEYGESRKNSIPAFASPSSSSASLRGKTHPCIAVTPQSCWNLLQLLRTNKICEGGQGQHSAALRVAECVVQRGWQDELQALSIHFICLMNRDRCFKGEQMLMSDSVCLSQHLTPPIL